jgi:pantetheine-phosphate adenylyltransferase
MIHEKHLRTLCGFPDIHIEEVTWIESRYQEGHRYFHTTEHLNEVFDHLDTSTGSLSFHDRMRVYLAALLHDAVYDPTRGDNEERSCDLLQYTGETIYVDRDNRDIIAQMIMDTKTHQPTTPLSKYLIDADMAVLKRPLPELLKWERAIFKEYSFVPLEVYKKQRIELLTKWSEEYSNPALLDLARYVETHKPSVGVYAGSFGPFHQGHLDIVHKANKVFDKVIVAQGINPAKAHVQRISLKEVSSLKYYETIEYSGLLTDLVSSLEGIYEPVLVRGLRDGDDLSYEVKQLRVMQDLKPDLKHVFFHSDQQYSHISSTVIRQLESFGTEEALAVAKRYKGE